LLQFAVVRLRIQTGSNVAPDTLIGVNQHYAAFLHCHSATWQLAEDVKLEMGGRSRK